MAEKEVSGAKKEKKAEKVTKKEVSKKVESKKETTKKKARQIENKSVQNKVIDNIKNFISKIIEMQEKVRRDEEEEKRLKQTQKDAVEAEKIPHPKHLLEYYDLPYRYNETIVKILAQTPKRLFVYWDISDTDKQTYLNAFGNTFFEDTYPVLLVHNENKNYTREIPINDFANSWYLDISDSRDQYSIQLGRKFKNSRKPQINPEIEENQIRLSNDYLLIAISNELEVPNDHILFEEFKPYVTYRNVKTYEEETRKVGNSVYQDELRGFYQAIYADQTILNENGKLDMRNPSSMGTSSSIAK